MVADQRQMAVVLDDVAVKMNEQRVEVSLEVVMIVEQLPEPLAESGVLWAVVASAQNVQPWAETDDSLQEQQHTRLELKAGFGVSLEEYECETHLLDPVRHPAQAIMEQAERLAVVLAVLSADCSAKPLVELSEPRNKHFLTSKFLPKEGCEK